jgi:hypothetical protein
MSSGARGKKNAEMAKMLKVKGVKRNTAACPRGCGAQLLNGGTALLSHLNVCQGKRHAA